MNDLWAGFGFPVLRVEQGDKVLTAPIHDGSAEGLLHLAKLLDRHLLDDTGCVLPSRQWQVKS